MPSGIPSLRSCDRNASVSSSFPSRPSLGGVPVPTARSHTARQRLTIEGALVRLVTIREATCSIPLPSGQGSRDFGPLVYDAAAHARVGRGATVGQEEPWPTAAPFWLLIAPRSVLSALRPRRAGVLNEDRARPDCRWLLFQSSTDRNPPIFRFGGWGEPQPGFRSLQQLVEAV